MFHLIFTKETNFMKRRQIIFSILAAFMMASYFLLFTPAIVTAFASETEIVEAAEDSLPQQYCMRDEYIIYAQNQDNHGYCWNFAATTSASTTIMKATGEYYDFSELWTAVSLYNSGDSLKKMGAGGTFSYQYDSMKKSGLMLETDLPYQYSYTVSNENATDYYNFYERYSNSNLANCLVTDKDTKFLNTDIDEIKNHIYNHGSVYLTFTFRTGFVEQDGAFALEPNQTNTTSNHAVSVIGWDDNFEREYYLNGSSTPVVFKGAWIILNSYTENNGNDGISFVFYNDKNIGIIQGYRYEPDTDMDLYFYDKIESGYAYPTSVNGKYYGDYTAKEALTKQKNIFYDDVALEYSYTASSETNVESIDIYLDGKNVTQSFCVKIDNDNQRFSVSKNNASYGQYKLLVTYGNGEKSDTYLNNFFVTHGLFGEEIEYDYDNNNFTFNPGRDLEYHSFISSEKKYVIYTNSLSGEVTFLPKEQSIYSDKNMSLPTVSYEITNGNSCSKTYTIQSDSGYSLDYSFTFEYYDDTTLQVVNVYYNLGGGINHGNNYSQELASPTSDLVLYEPTRPGYTFAGWYLDYGNGSKEVSVKDGIYYVDWDDIHHMGESPTLNASSYYKNYYNNSNTLFVYARWEEEEYYNVELSIIGEGKSNICESISIHSDDSVRYILSPEKEWCLSELTVNGIAVSGEELIDIVDNGLLVENLEEDVYIIATFSKGVYLSLKFGENIKAAYLVGTKGGESRMFYDGDIIPVDYFDGIKDRFEITLPEKHIIPFENAKVDINKIDGPLPPIFIFPGFGTQFTLVVEVFDDADGYSYVLDNAVNYIVLEKGKFSKTIVIDSKDKYEKIDVGSATKILIESVEFTYSVNSYVEDHFVTTDINAKSGDKNSAIYDAGQIVYLFIKKPANTAVYLYRVPDGFVAAGNNWYRKAICVNSAEPNLGIVSIGRELQTYTVTWENWDGSVIYSEDYRYGETPVFHNNLVPSEYPLRPNDELYRYVFAGWSRPIESVKTDITYTATYDAVLLQYVVNVEHTENGTVTPDGSNEINGMDRHTYIFTPDPGYKIKDVILNGESIGALSYYTFSEVRSDQTLFVEFERIKYNFNVICDRNGRADQIGSIEFEYGSTLTINISPEELLNVDCIKVNGEVAEISNSLILNDITEDTLVEIYFKQVLFSITATRSDNGIIMPSVKVSVGNNIRIDDFENIVYRVKDVIVDGDSVGSADCHVFVNVDRDHTIYIERERNMPLIFATLVVSALLVGSTIWFMAAITIRKRRAKRRKLQFFLKQRTMSRK